MRIPPLLPIDYEILDLFESNPRLTTEDYSILSNYELLTIYARLMGLDVRGLIYSRPHYMNVPRGKHAHWYPTGSKN